jgi:hypothetical protein
MRGAVFAVLLSLAAAIVWPVGASHAQSLAQERLLDSLRRELTDKLQASGKFSSIATTNKTTLKAKTLDGGEFSISLDNMMADIAQKPMLRPEIVDKFVRSMLATIEPGKKAVTREDFIAALRLVIRPRDYLSQLGDGKSSAMPLWRPFAGSALTFVAIDKGERLEIALAGAGKDYGISDDALFDFGREQLRRFLPDIEIEDAAGVRAFTLPDEAYSPSLLLLDEPWAQVEQDFGVGFVVAIPDRNTLLAAPAKNAAQLRKAVELVATSRKTPAMIPELLQRSGAGWSILRR